MRLSFGHSSGGLISQLYESQVVLRAQFCLSKSDYGGISAADKGAAGIWNNEVASSGFVASSSLAAAAAGINSESTDPVAAAHQ